MGHHPVRPEPVEGLRQKAGWLSHPCFDKLSTNGMRGARSGASIPTVRPEPVAPKATAGQRQLPQKIPAQTGSPKPQEHHPKLLIIHIDGKLAAIGAGQLVRIDVQDRAELDFGRAAGHLDLRARAAGIGELRPDRLARPVEIE